MTRYRAVLPGPVTEFTLLGLHTAISIGSQLARIAARSWGLAGIEDAAEQATGHLIARAVETTGHPDPNPRYADIDPASVANVGVRVHRRAEALIVDVWDTDPTPPDPATPDEHLAVVAVLARRWASYPSPCGGGKVIWAEIAPPGGHPAHHGAAGHPPQPARNLMERIFPGDDGDTRG